MSILTAFLAVGPATMLLLTGLLPTGFANRNVRQVRRSVTWLAGIQFLAATLALALALPGMLAGSAPLAMHWPEAVIAASLYFDGFAALMLALVSFVGFVVCRYSIRYLDGEDNQGRFFRWVGMTIGAVSLVVISGNLLMLFLAWVLTSFGLHHLLLHYPQRKAAHDAAWTKFTISRAGDALLLTGITLCYLEFGTLEVAELFTAAKNSSGSASLTAIAWLFMFGAVTKSAQFPLHSWLPNTMETPTPVSALMHAGIVNAGGYLVIRLSPLLVATPSALAVLAIIGSITVAYAGIVMLTQTSVKRSLAYSTIAQMGFMMLQCGLGAFSAAMLHILAHSLYKAYAFLNSGNVVTESVGMRKTKANHSKEFAVSALTVAVAVSSFSVLFASLLFGVDLISKQGGLVLGFILTLALTTWLWEVMKLSSTRATLTGFAVTATLALCYMAGYVFVDRMVAANSPTMRNVSYLNAVAITDAFVVFCALFGVHWLLSTARGKQLLYSLQIHASNGFYVEAATRRITAGLQGK